MPPKKKAKVEESVRKSAKEKADEDDVSEHEEDQVNEKGNTKKRGRNQKKSDEPLKNQSATDYSSQDFTCKATNKDGEEWNLKIATWNVDGLRAWVKKGGLEYLEHEKPDILCLQETKCADNKLPNEVKEVAGYHIYWCGGETEGYAGLGLYSKEKPISVAYGLGNADFDKEGRLMVAEYENFYLVNVYVPNAGRKLVTLPRRMEWDPLFRNFLKDLDSKKPVILCGDLNVAHQEIDIANPKSNKKNAGFTPEEREGFSKLLSEGFIDSFRNKYPDVKGAYTFWTYMANARKKNVGWRLDYCLLSERLLSNFCDCLIRNQVFGSDHCPMALFMHM